MKASTAALHADGEVSHGAAVGPDLSVSTTFRFPAPERSVPGVEDPEDRWADWDPHTPQADIYTRYTQPTLTRAERVLSAVCRGHALAYGSGLTAVMAALMHVQPDVIAITDGYHGTSETIKLYLGIRGNHCSGKPKVDLIPLTSDFPKGKRVLAWVETPLNPTGECLDLRHYAEKVHASSSDSVLVVDATFGPPPLQDPFAHGADLVMHSGTKYLTGHSDALVGVLVARPDAKERWYKLWHDRTYSGTRPGSLESWLLLRSLRTLHVRVPVQSATATALAQWLHQIATTASSKTVDGVQGGIVAKVWHASLQDGGKYVGQGKQMASGPACFSILLAKPGYAKWLPFSVKLFTPATSLGGVESLMERRKDSDPKSDARLVRLSIGLEDIEDLKEDLRAGFAAVLARERESKL